ncbi:transposase, partial [Streptomyces sp. NPDC057575]
MPQIWAGVDIGKEHHHCVVIDAQGKRLLSRRCHFVGGIGVWRCVRAWS